MSDAKTLYLECNSGISGDMTVAALLDLGVPEDDLIKNLHTLPLDGYQVVISRVQKSGIDCLDFDVQLDKEIDGHDHDMDYLYGHEHGEHTHSHEHGEHTHGHKHKHPARNLSSIEEIIDASQMTDHAKMIAKKIFMILAEAEAKAHGLPLDQVHFHEVGAVDSIVDICAIAYCVDYLNINKAIIPRVMEGYGTVRCQHGILPVPVPATTNIAAKYSLPLQIMNMQGEFVTPTGAAFLAAIMTDRKLPEAFTIKSVGYGAGKRTYERPSFLRAMIIEES